MILEGRKGGVCRGRRKVSESLRLEERHKPLLQILIGHQVVEGERLRRRIYQIKERRGVDLMCDGTDLSSSLQPDLDCCFFKDDARARGTDRVLHDMAIDGTQELFRNRGLAGVRRHFTSTNEHLRDRLG
jgi:hypothetical protein